MVDLNLLKVLVPSNSEIASHRSAMSMLTYQQACFFSLCCQLLVLGQRAILAL
jgi:hypothetical protein